MKPYLENETSNPVTGVKREIRQTRQLKNLWRRSGQGPSIFHSPLEVQRSDCHGTVTREISGGRSRKNTGDGSHVEERDPGTVPPPVTGIDGPSMVSHLQVCVPFVDDL